jgi:cob(I)alamin adenosyltransferase
MKIYTKTGDRGQTGLLGGTRVSKADLRVAAYGDIDELNSVIGLARAEGVEARVDAWLHVIQSELFDLGAELATTPDKSVKLSATLLGEAEIARLESHIDALEADLPELTAFILPGGSKAAATLHLARTVCRRAERTIVLLADREPVRNEVVRHVNRLSDLLFVMARFENHRAAIVDVAWIGRAGRRENEPSP